VHKKGFTISRRKIKYENYELHYHNVVYTSSRETRRLYNSCYGASAYTRVRIIRKPRLLFSLVRTTPHCETSCFPIEPSVALAPFSTARAISTRQSLHANISIRACITFGHEEIRICFRSPMCNTRVLCDTLNLI